MGTGAHPYHGSGDTLTGAWPIPQPTTSTIEATRYGLAVATTWDPVHPRLTRRACWMDHPGAPRLMWTAGGRIGQLREV